MNNNINPNGLIYPNPCPHCGKENTKKACYEFLGEQNGRKYSVCLRGGNPGNGWEQAKTHNNQDRRDKAGNLVYQEIIPYNSNGSKAYEQNKLEAEYYYQDRQNKPLVKIAKYRKPDGDKYYPQYHYTADSKWEKGIKGFVKREYIPIYRYSDIRLSIEHNQPIYITEGEKCAVKLFELGLPATCNLGGARNAETNPGRTWSDSDTEDLYGASELILVPDRDVPGLMHMSAVETKLKARYPNLIIKWLYPYPNASEWLNLPKSHGLGIDDWIDDGATKKKILEAVREKRTDIPIPSPDQKSDRINPEQSTLLDPEQQRILDTLNFLLHDKDGKRKKMFNNLAIDIMKIIYGKKLRYNLLTHEPWLENKPFSEAEGDVELIHMRLAQDYDIEIGKERAIEAFLYVAKQNSFHPIEEYLKGCANSVKPIAIDNLATKYFGIKSELANKYLELWLIATAARVIYPGCYVRNVLVLQGKQNIGKSTFFRVLGGNYFSDSLGDGKSKDQLLVAHRKWIHEWAEFEKLYRKASRSEIKSFITATEDTFRVPYGKSTNTYPRRFVLCGTSNEDTFLNDPTGNDRFWIIPVRHKISLEQLAQDRDAIWSTATKIIFSADRQDIMTGKLWKLPEHLLEINRENTSQFEEKHEWEDTIQGLLEDIGSCGIMLPDKIWEALDIDLKDRPKHGNKLNEIMTKFGWKKSKKQRRSKGKRNRIWIIQDFSEEDADSLWEECFK